MAERQKGIQVHRPIIYGSHARLLTDEEKQRATPGHTHRWTVFLASATSPPPPPQTGSSDLPPEDMDYLPGGHDDLSYALKRVTFRLHETYANPSRGGFPASRSAPFKVSETGWGEFTVQIRLQFVQESGEKPLTLAHPIKLHHWGAPIEGPPPVPAPVPTSGVPAAESTDKEGSEAVKAEVQTPVPISTSSPKPSTPAPPSTGAEPAESPMISQPLEFQPLGPVSIASKLPVHAWQYDELVFSDPPSNFLSILNANPPTPLPAKNRRARDQREAHEIRVSKKARPRASVSEDGGTAEPPAVTATPAAGVAIGIPGEPGSADVPLEFTREMEEGEWTRLNDARIRIVAEMDRWRWVAYYPASVGSDKVPREKLISEEKELVKLKEEMGLS